MTRIEEGPVSDSSVAEDARPAAATEQRIVGGAVFAELAARLDQGLSDMQALVMTDAAQRLRAPAAALERLADRPVPDTLPGLEEAFGALEEILDHLDLHDALAGKLVEAQITALETGGALWPESNDTVRASDEAHGAAALSAAISSIGSHFFEATRPAVKAIVAASVGHHAAIASAATRCSVAEAPDDEGDETPEAGPGPPEAGAPPPETGAPPLETGAPPPEAGAAPPDGASGEPSDTETPDPVAELAGAVSAFADWLSDDPLDDLRASIATLIEEHAGVDPPKKVKPAPAVTAEGVGKIRTKWGSAIPSTRPRSELARLALAREVVDFRVFLNDFVSEWLLASPDASAGEAIGHLDSAVSALRGLHAEAEAHFAASGDGSSPARLLDRASAAIEAASTALQAIGDDAGPMDATGAGVAALSERVGRFPDAMLVAPLIDPGEAADVRDDPVALEPRGWAEDVFGVACMERLRDAALPYSETLRYAVELLPDARSILEYNLGAAADMLESPEPESSGMEKELVLGGLDRTANRLDEAVTRLQEARATAPLAAELVLSRATGALLARAQAEGSLEGRARDVWATLNIGADVAGTWAEREARRVGKAAAALFRQGASRSIAMVRRAREAVGADPVAAERVDATIRTIANVDSVANDLPFVYRRLFSYRPLTDASLLMGRDAEIAFLDEHLERWLAGTPDALSIVGSSGVGVSSLINVMRLRWGDAVAWCPVALHTRTTEEDLLAARLGEALGLHPVPSTLADVERMLLERPAPDLPQVCAFDNLQLLYRRGVLDSGLIARTIRLMSATDSSVCWLAPLSSTAWQVLSALNPGVTGLTRFLELRPLSRDDIQAAILSRHQRSGIPLRLGTPDEPSLGLRRALAKADSEDERQQILSDAFFDRLFELSDGYVALALLYWLRSIRLDARDDTLQVDWPTPIDFGAWDDLDSDGAFALRALLEHGSLTIAEYQDVFRASEDRAYAVFERLGNLLLIEAVVPDRPVGAPLRFRRIDSLTRYRIRPVLVRPVERLLEGRRLIY